MAWIAFIRLSIQQRRTEGLLSSGLMRFSLSARLTAALFTPGPEFSRRSRLAVIPAQMLGYRSCWLTETLLNAPLPRNPFNEGRKSEVGRHEAAACSWRAHGSAPLWRSWDYPTSTLEAGPTDAGLGGITPALFHLSVLRLSVSALTFPPRQRSFTAMVGPPPHSSGCF